MNEEGGGSPLRHYAVDGVHSVTAANADHRLRVQSGRRVAALVARLGNALADHGLELPLEGGAPAGDIDDEMGRRTGAGPDRPPGRRA